MDADIIQFPQSQSGSSEKPGEPSCSPELLRLDIVAKILRESGRLEDAPDWVVRELANDILKAVFRHDGEASPK